MFCDAHEAEIEELRSTINRFVEVMPWIETRSHTKPNSKPKKILNLNPQKKENKMKLIIGTLVVIALQAKQRENNISTFPISTE